MTASVTSPTRHALRHTSVTRLFNSCSAHVCSRQIQSALDKKRFSNVTVTAGSESLLISHLISEDRKASGNRRGLDMLRAYAWNPRMYHCAHTRESHRGEGTPRLSLDSYPLETAQIVFYSHRQLRKTGFSEAHHLHSNTAQSLIQSHSTGGGQIVKNAYFGHRASPFPFINVYKKGKK